MNWPVPISQTLIAFALHVAIITALLAALGSMAAFAMRRISATIRRELMVGLLMAIVAVPALAGVYHFRLLTPATPETIGKAAAPSSSPPVFGQGFVEREELGTGGIAPARSIRWVKLIGICFVSLWLPGIGVQLVRGCRAAWCRRVLWRSLAPVQQGDALLTLDRLRREMGIRRPVRLVTSPLAPCPFTTGLLRPQIVVPTRLIELASAQKLEAALIHELVHIERLDLIPHAVGSLAAAVHWWCPWVRSITAELSRAAEEICDDRVLALQRNGQPLAELLVECAQSAAGLHAATAICMSTGSPTELKQRVNQLLSVKESNMMRLRRSAACLLAALPIAAVLLLVHANYARAEFIFGTPVNFGPVINSTSTENDPFLSYDGLTLYFNSGRQGGGDWDDIWISTCDSIESEWKQPESFTAINTSWAERTPSISNDGLTFLYSQTSPAGRGKVYQLTRDLPEGPWGPPKPLPAPINNDVSDSHPFISSAGLTLLFVRAGGDKISNIWEAVRTSLGDPWTVRKLGPNINTPATENSPVMAADGLTLLFASRRPGGEGELDIWMTKRDTVFAAWEPATNLGPTINTPGQDRPSQLWEPGNLLLFKSGSNNGPPGLPGQGASDLFYVTVVPEPSTGAMSICGIVLLCGFVRIRLQRS